MALWDSFAEAVRDIVKATLRGRIVDLPPTLPERLAAREKNLATDLEVQRQWGAAVEPFYAGLSEEQKQGTDELMVRLFGV